MWNFTLPPDQTFAESESIKTISIPIINDNQYEADVDFYVILKNPVGQNAAIGDPSIARVTIIDDDGERSIEAQSQSHEFVNIFISL